MSKKISKAMLTLVTVLTLAAGFAGANSVSADEVNESDQLNVLQSEGKESKETNVISSVEASDDTQLAHLGSAGINWALVGGGILVVLLAIGGFLFIRKRENDLNKKQ